MQKHIAAYLFQLNRISLPGLGSFSVSGSAAEPDFVNKLIKAPGTAIYFNETINEDAADDFMQYAARKEGISRMQADEQYSRWCSGVKQQLQQGVEAAIAGVGTLKQQHSNIVFEQANLPSAFFPAVKAERVVHPEAAHSILVGDKETTNVEMTEYFAAEPVRKDRWWLWAILLGLLGAGIALYQVFENGSGISGTGNAVKINTAAPGSLYRIAE